MKIKKLLFTLSPLPRLLLVSFTFLSMVHKQKWRTLLHSRGFLKVDYRLISSVIPIQLQSTNLWHRRAVGRWSYSHSWWSDDGVQWVWRNILPTSPSKTAWTNRLVPVTSRHGCHCTELLPSGKVEYFWFWNWFVFTPF